jgi:hypothetical protein
MKEESDLNLLSVVIPLSEKQNTHEAGNSYSQKAYSHFTVSGER